MAGYVLWKTGVDPERLTLQLGRIHGSAALLSHSHYLHGNDATPPCQAETQGPLVISQVPVLRPAYLSQPNSPLSEHAVQEVVRVQMENMRRLHRDSQVRSHLVARGLVGMLMRGRDLRLGLTV
jgi:hypothetical protein